jgi:hypothetical protein
MKNILPIAIGIIVILGGFYYVKSPIAPLIPVDKNVLAVQSAKEVVKILKPCDILKKNKDFKGQCEFISIGLNTQRAAVVKLSGDVVSYGIVLPTGDFQPISTDLYFSPKNKVNEYLKSFGIVATDEDWDDVQTELYLSKRGYLLSLKFRSPKEGLIFISPNGRITGKLK